MMVVDEVVVDDELSCCRTNPGKSRDLPITQLGLIQQQSVMSLDALKSEIATKRKLASDENSKPSKYMRRGELEKLQQEEERKKKEAGKASAEENSRRIAETNVCISFTCHLLQGVC